MPWSVQGEKAEARLQVYAGVEYDVWMYGKGLERVLSFERVFAGGGEARIDVPADALATEQ